MRSNMGRPAARRVVWTLDGRTLSDPSQQLWQVGRTGKMTMEGYLGISMDILEITDVDIKKDILGYYKEIRLRYHMDIQVYLRIFIDIYKRYLMDIMRMTKEYLYWISLACGYLRISIRYLVWNHCRYSQVIVGY